ncbi:MAG: hypothetical protein DI569_01635 [Sphingopyxis macrogoltabida]|uniref:AcrB/AcrD/AcrF family protein n=1 Tax=Sphingopyxis macrogoltabida TaxID=33050 RepID=A0A2W5L476_SPHMC|nr:MAG: hypothetical protein DI569_01635 [Sphingopyxis macrogoltabida]
MTGAPAPTAPGLPRWLTPVRFALIVWGAMSLIAIAAHWHAIVALQLSDTDDAVRMVQVRDLLAGQGWWDLVQHRINPVDGGVLMHWSRIVDAPLALGIVILKPLVGQALAEQIVMALWPPLLGALLAAAMVRGYRGLDDRRIVWAAPFFLILSGFIIAQFRPLRVDHHGWQILLAMLVMGQALRPASRRAGLWGGVAAAALLAVSIEGLPMAALFAALAALRWILSGRSDDAQRLTGYMTGLAGGALAFQFATRGPAGLAGTWCDSLSAPYLAAFAAAAGVTAAAVAARPARRRIRVLLLGGAGLIAGALLVGIEPQCAKGPFASLDPIVVDYWYRSVLEGQPLWRSTPHDAIFVLVPEIIGLAGTILAWRAAPTAADRRDWATILIALAGASLLSLLVMRSVSTAHLFAIPGAAWIGLRVWDRARAIGATLPRVAASVLASLTLPLFASIAVAVPLGWAVPAFRSADDAAGGKPEPEQQCFDDASIAALNRLAPTTILAPIDLGSPLLFLTPHNQVATGHHRNREAMADAIKAFVGDPAKAEALVRGRGATLIVVCPTANDFQQYRESRKDSLAARLYDRKPPDWLEPLPIAARKGLRVWRVRPAGN